ncbi:MAG: peptidoglycan-binding protein, partial [Cyanobacteria bacterium J06635_11]
LLSMLGWHWQLPATGRILNLQGHSAESLIRAMGVDTARYVDVAFETLGLQPWVRSPVIISKSGFGRSDERDRTELTYSALVQFSLPRTGRNGSMPDPTAAYQRYSLCFTLIASQNTGNANAEARYVDALMAASVTEIIRRATTETL